MKLIEILQSQGSTTAKEEALKRQAKRVELQAQADLLETESKISELEEERQKELLNQEISLSKIVEIEMEIDSYREGKRRIETKIKEWF
jgi:hypothetical protein